MEISTFTWFLFSSSSTPDICLRFQTSYLQRFVALCNRAECDELPGPDVGKADNPLPKQRGGLVQGAGHNRLIGAAGPQLQTLSSSGSAIGKRHRNLYEHDRQALPHPPAVLA